MNDRDRLKKIRRLYEMAKELPKEERSAAVANACSDGEIVRQVNDLLMTSDDDFLRQDVMAELAEIIVEDSESEPTLLKNNDPIDKAGRYLIEARLGKGGMGEVYLARDVVLNRKVAVKTIPPEFANDPNRLKRFELEARALASLNHPYIINILEFGVSPEGKYFIVSEYVEGSTLREHLEDERPPLSTRINLGIQIVSAISTAHKANIIHRDIKPENVIVRPDGFLKVLDFGLAKPLGMPADEVDGAKSGTKPDSITDPGTIMGTPAYVSPEQISGRRVDKRTDIWSIGVLLYEIVEDKKPFAGDTVNHTIVEILENEPPALSHGPKQLQYLIAKALEKEPAQRYQTLDDLLDDLVVVRDLLRSDHNAGGAQGAQNIGNRETLSFSDRGSRDNKERSTKEPGTRTAHYSLKQIRDIKFMPFGGVALAASLLVVVAAVFMGRMSWQPAAIEPGEALRNVGVTRWASGVTELFVGARFSPDSKLIAYSSAATGSTQIWTRPVGGGRDVRVTDDDFYNQYPTWSPSGDEIAFFSLREGAGGIWRIPFLGGTSVQVLGGLERDVKVRLWSKTGVIYFEEGSELYAVTVASGRMRKVTAFSTADTRPRQIDISKDERQIAYVTQEGKLWSLKVAALGKNDGKTLIESNVQITDIAWHPDGKSVYFSRMEGNAIQIFRVGTSGSDEVQLTNGDLNHYVKDVSDNGRVLYHSATEEGDLWQVQIDSRKQKVLANDSAVEFWGDISPKSDEVVYQSVNKAFSIFSGPLMVKSIDGNGPAMAIAGSGFAPLWSPKSNKIAFLKRVDEVIELWTVDGTGANAKRLSAGDILTPAYLLTPYLKTELNPFRWSPDGNEIAYISRRSGRWNLWVVGAGGSDDRRVSDNQNRQEYFCSPMWLEHGLVYRSREVTDAHDGTRKYSIQYLDRKSGVQRQLFESTEEIRLLGVDPSKRRVLFAMRTGSGGTHPIPKEVTVFSVSVENGDPRVELKLGFAYFHSISISPSSDLVAYVSRENSTSEIKVASRSNKAKRTILTERDPKVLISSISWSKDESRLVFGRQVSSNFISMLTD